MSETWQNSKRFILIQFSTQNTKAKKFITIRSPSKPGPSPNILSIKAQHSCLRSLVTFFFCKKKDDSAFPDIRIPIRNKSSPSQQHSTFHNQNQINSSNLQYHYTDQLKELGAMKLGNIEHVFQPSEYSSSERKYFVLSVSY